MVTRVIWRRKLWLGAAIGLAATPVLDACAKAPDAGKGASPRPAAAPAPAASAAPVGESGEAGVGDAYSQTAGAETTLLRLQHLKGFVLVAQKMAATGALPEAGILIDQGLLEAADPAPQQLGALDRGVLTAASKALGDGQAGGVAALSRAVAAIDAAQKANGAPADAKLVRLMLAIAEGLYSGVMTADGVDPIEYQHSFGAALSAQAAFKAAYGGFARKDAGRAEAAAAEFDKLLSLWPGPVAPDAPTANSRIVAAISRIELYLSGLE